MFYTQSLHQFDWFPTWFQTRLSSPLCHGQLNSPNTYGRFLRSFSKQNEADLREKLIQTSLARGAKLHPYKSDRKRKRPFALDIDSSSHIQYGKKMEGVEVNYCNRNCLDSLQAYDEHGYPYWLDVRPGRTHTATGTEEVIQNVFKHVDRNTNRFVCADSGYGNQKVFNACANADANFVIAGRANVYKLYTKRIERWQKNQITCSKWHPTWDRKLLVLAGRMSTNISYRDDQVAWWGRPSEWYFRARRLRIPCFFTNVGEFELNNEKIVKFYRKRDHAEFLFAKVRMGLICSTFPASRLQRIVFTRWSLHLPNLTCDSRGIYETKIDLHLQKSFVFTL